MKILPKKVKVRAKKFNSKFLRRKSTREQVSDLLRMTNDNVAEHREEVLSSARKFVLPLQHSKHRIVVVSTILFITAIVSFMIFSIVGLYVHKSSSDFLYGVTRVIPFPIAKVGNSYVSYENYLFELRHYVHYYETQQKTDFTEERFKQQITDYKVRALEEVINSASVRHLASKNKVSVSDRELNDLYTLVRNQNRLGSNEKGFEDVLQDNYGWSIADFKRELKQQLLAQKVVGVLDTATSVRAKAALAELNAGADFAAVAAKYSDDLGSKNNGGDYGIAIDKSNRDVPPQLTNELFKLSNGQISGIVNTGYSLEIVKAIEIQGDKIRSAHIVFKLKDINSYISDLNLKQKTTTYIKL